jgi:hypothetical protein
MRYARSIAKPATVVQVGNGRIIRKIDGLERRLEPTPNVSSAVSTGPSVEAATGDEHVPGGGTAPQAHRPRTERVLLPVLSRAAASSLDPLDPSAALEDAGAGGRGGRLPADFMPRRSPSAIVG